MGGARGWRVMEPRIQYAKASDGVSIAYTVLGTGPLIVFPSNIWGSLHLFKNEAFDLATSYFNQLVSLGWSVITYDGRGTGASDRNTGDWNLEARLRDLNAVLDRTAPDRFALCGEAQGGPAAISYAVENPKRVSHLVLSNTFAAGSDWYGVIPAFRTSQLMLRDAEEDWAFAMLSLANAVTGYANSERARALAEIFRTGIRPRDFVAYRDAAEKMDVRDLLSQISVPTMVMYDRTWILDGVGILAHRLAPLIPNARLVETTEPVKTIDEFLREASVTAKPILPSGMSAILFADIADSTALTERLGDTAFRAKARDLDASLRAVIRENGGTPIEGKVLGDGVMAVFASAREAIEAALACAHAGDAAGLPLHLGLHAGDVIREENNVYGGAVNIASRISGLSAPGEVLVSDTVRSLARTSAGVSFEDRGEQSLKGVGEAVRVWAVAS